MMPKGLPPLLRVGITPSWQVAASSPPTFATMIRTSGLASRLASVSLAMESGITGSRGLSSA